LLVAVVMLVAVTACAGLWMEHRTAVELPRPTGLYAVGRSMDVWRDDLRLDPLVDGPERRTELVVWTWYPAVPSEAARADYLPADWRRAIAGRQGTLLSTFLMHDPARVVSHSSVAPALSPKEGRYPVVILRAGLGALTSQYTTLAEDLASHGYIVVGFDVPLRTGVVVFPDGRVIVRPARLDPETLPSEQQDALLDKLMAAWVLDIGYVVDRLTSATASFGRHIEVARLAVVGHSLGGAAAAEFCRDSRCKAVVDIDGALHGGVRAAGLDKPVMFVTSDHGDTLSTTDQRIQDELHAVYARLPADSRVAWRIQGADHFSSSDQLLLRSRLLRGRLKLEPRRGLALVCEAVGRFLDVQLKSAPVSDLKVVRQRYPEVQEMFEK
jgi:predicted dienelactone hydrolase